MNIAAFDLNLLKVLDAVLREGSVTAAAQRLHLSQPAVSAALGRLRHAFQDELLVRDGQGLRPTDRALALELPVRDVLDRVEAILGESRFDAAASQATFKISGSDFFAEMLMPRLGDMLAGEAPGVRVQLVDLVPSNYIETLQRYEADIALIPMMNMPAWCEWAHAFWSSFSVIARVDHPLLAAHEVEAGGTMPMDVFCALDHVLFSPEGNLSAMGDEALRRVGRRRRVVMTLPVFSGVLSAVQASDRIAVLPTQLAKAKAGERRLNVYRPPMDIAPAQIIMVWHRRASNNPAHRWLRERIAATLAPLEEADQTAAAANGAAPASTTAERS